MKFRALQWNYHTEALLVEKKKGQRKTQQYVTNELHTGPSAGTLYDSPSSDNKKSVCFHEAKATTAKEVASDAKTPTQVAAAPSANVIPSPSRQGREQKAILPKTSNDFTHAPIKGTSSLSSILHRVSRFPLLMNHPAYASASTTTQDSTNTKSMTNKSSFLSPMNKSSFLSPMDFAVQVAWMLYSLKGTTPAKQAETTMQTERTLEGHAPPQCVETNNPAALLEIVQDPVKQKDECITLHSHAGSYAPFSCTGLLKTEYSLDSFQENMLPCDYEIDEEKRQDDFFRSEAGDKISHLPSSQQSEGTDARADETLQQWLDNEISGHKEEGEPLPKKARVSFLENTHEHSSEIQEPEMPDIGNADCIQRLKKRKSKDKKHEDRKKRHKKGKKLLQQQNNTLTSQKGEENDKSTEDLPECQDPPNRTNSSILRNFINQRKNHEDTLRKTKESLSRTRPQSLQSQKKTGRLPPGAVTAYKPRHSRQGSPNIRRQRVDLNRIGRSSSFAEAAPRQDQFPANRYASTEVTRERMLYEESFQPLLDEGRTTHPLGHLREKTPHPLRGSSLAMEPPILSNFRGTKSSLAQQANRDTSDATPECKNLTSHPYSLVERRNAGESTSAMLPEQVARKRPALESDAAFLLHMTDKTENLRDFPESVARETDNIPSPRGEQHGYLLRNDQAADQQTYGQSNQRNDPSMHMQDQRHDPNQDQLRIFCSEHFLQHWPSIVGSLTYRGIELVDTSLVDQCSVDIELGGRAAILLCPLQELLDQSVCREKMWSIAALAGIGRYRHLFIILILDEHPTAPHTRSIYQKIILSLHTATIRQNSVPPTATHINTTTRSTLSECIAQIIIASVALQQEQERISTDLDSLTVQRVQFLLKLAPTLTVLGAIQAIEIACKSDGSGFVSLLVSEKTRQQVSLQATAIPSKAGEVNKLAMVQLSQATQAVLGNDPFLL